MAVRILLVEDDKSIGEVVYDYFQNKFEEGMEMIVALDGDEGLFRIENDEFDIVLLDVMLPGIDGFSLCRRLRKKSTAPVLFLTARGREEDILHGYDMGCDDYIVKPFSLAVLLTKVKALLKRSKGLISTNTLVCGKIELNPTTFQVYINGQEIDLAPKEYSILKMLISNKNSVVSREKLITRIWGYDFEGDERVLDNHMKKLRNALGPYGSQVKTVITKGYKLTE